MPRFSLAAFEASRNSDPVWWNSKRNDMGRGIYGEALRESRRLTDATEAEIEAELDALTGGAFTRLSRRHDGGAGLTDP